MKKTMSTIFLALTGITAFSMNAQADIVIYQGLEGGSGDVQNVLFNDSNRDEIAFTVDGFLNQSGQIVDFTGTENLETPSGGQARIEAADGTFNFITFGFKDPTLGFDKVQFNIDAVNDGTVNLIFTDQFGTAWSGSGPYHLDGSGQNFFTAIAENGQLINTVTINSEGSMTALSDLAQVRMSPGSASPPSPNGVVPEPATMVLLGAGMAGLGLVGSRKRRK